MCPKAVLHNDLYAGIIPLPTSVTIKSTYSVEYNTRSASVDYLSEEYRKSNFAYTEALGRIFVVLRLQKNPSIFPSLSVEARQVFLGQLFVCGVLKTLQQRQFVND
jgi:hypothetical protein